MATTRGRASDQLVMGGSMGMRWGVRGEERMVREENVRSVRWALRAEKAERWA